MFFFLCGTHCAGKTSILQTLEAEGVLSFRGTEIGKDLYYERRFDPEGQGRAFEYEVTRRELARDEELLETSGIIGIETWHPGNLAYAAVRNPPIVPGLAGEIARSPWIGSARGIWIRGVRAESIEARTRTFSGNPQWAARFYTAIEAQIEPALRRLGLWERTILLDGEAPLPLLIEQVRQVILETQGG
ncbi:MAG: hypothetical protein D6795_15895 [Deltaproteobacteria bacterium]|nr:MAG: hypothetical protein D6795_15895 [Deltaproteobacteria bacterium]